MTTLNWIQTSLWLAAVVLGFGAGLSDRINQSFWPTFSEGDYITIWLSILYLMCVVGSLPVLYKWFEKK